MPKIPRPKQCPPTFLEFILERMLGPPARRGVDYATWRCPFHGDSHPSFCTRPHHPDFKDRWSCFGCAQWGDELDFLKLYYPREDYSARLERLRVLREEYKAVELANGPDVKPPGMGSSVGETILRALLHARQIDHCDLLEVVAELNHRRSLAMEWQRLGRKGKDVELARRFFDDPENPELIKQMEREGQTVGERNGRVGTERGIGKAMVMVYPLSPPPQSPRRPTYIKPRAAGGI